MAKRKLSEKDRAGVRRMLKRGVAKGTPQSELLKSVAKVYGISTETARYYLKSLQKGKTKKRKPAAKRKPAKATRRRRRKRRAARNGQPSAPDLVRKARAAARDRAREVVTLKRLLPEYNQVRRSQEKLQGRLQEVRQLERAVSGSLRQATKRAKKLESQLRGLVKA